MQNAPSAIPAFSLYGEKAPWPTPELLHCETIAHRSRQYDWKIAPHRHHGVAQILYLEAGQADVHLDESSRSLQGPCLVLVPELCVHGFDFTPGVAGYVLSLASPLLHAIATRHTEMESPLARPAVHSLGNGQGPVTAAIGRLVTEYFHPQPGRLAMLESLTATLMIAIGRQLLARVAAPAQERDRNAQRFAAFREQVEQHYRGGRPLGAYAAELGISTTYLNTLCRRYGGHSALRIVHERQLLEAKRALI